MGSARNSVSSRASSSPSPMYRPHRTLDHRHVDAFGGRALRPPDLSDVLPIEPQEQRKLSEPVVEQRSAVNEDQGAARS
jgi:hypothetical protein